MSPEQAGGRTVDARTDIYALGVILFELATGQLPFAVKTITEAVFKHSFVAPPQPRSIRADLPEALETAILRCLAKTPEERYASAADLAAALRELTGSTPDLAAASIAALPAGTTQVGTVMGYAAGGAAPDAASLAGASSLPRIQVLDEGGTLLQVVAVRPGGISVGRLSANDLHLDAPDVSRHHLQVLWDGMRVTVTDLGSKSGTELNGTRLAPQAGVEWPWTGMLHVGHFWLRLEAPTSRALERQVGAGGRGAAGLAIGDDKMSGGKSQIVGRSSVFGTTGRIAMVLDPEALALVPGRPATVEVLLANLGDEADQASLSISGVPESWVTLPPAVQLAASGQASARMTISVPENADGRAGEYPVEVRARSRVAPSESAIVLVRWSVRAMAKAALSIAPARIVTRGRAIYRVTIRNEGNAPATYRLIASDDSDELELALETEQVNVDPDAPTTIKLQASHKPRLIGAETASRVEVRAQSSDGRAVAPANTLFVHQAMAPPWTLLVLVALILLSFGGVMLSGVLGSNSLGVSRIAGGSTTIAETSMPTELTEIPTSDEVVLPPALPSDTATATTPTDSPTPLTSVPTEAVPATATPSEIATIATDATEVALAQAQTST